MYRSSPLPRRTSRTYHFGDPSVLSAAQESRLIDQGFPSGLLGELRKIKSVVPIRWWILDNSGSMKTNDGHIVRGSRDNLRVVSCTRWTELQVTMEYHADMAGLLQMPTVFRLLNDPGMQVGPQEFSIATGETITPATINEDVARARTVISRCVPNGVTPLALHLKAIYKQIKSLESLLRDHGQQAVIVVATDGNPSDERGEESEDCKQEFIDALKMLQDLPVWIVIRLCTDVAEVVDYYNDLDKTLEIKMEVIDDFFGESKEIFKCNPWLTYSAPIHRMREMGFNHHVFDLLDERLLCKDELLDFLSVLFGEDAVRNLPSIHEDWKGFLAAVELFVKDRGVQYNPVKRRMDYWIDMRQLRKAYKQRVNLRRLLGR